MHGDPTVPGTRWMKFWTRVGLPGVGVFAMVMSFSLPEFRYEVFPIGIVCIATAFGLHQGRLWAWRSNWIVLGVITLALLVPLPLREIHGGFANFVARGIVRFISPHFARDGVGDPIVPFAIRLVLVSLLWALPNWLYWKNRQGLFS